MLFEIKVRYAKQTGEDNPANVKEVYVIEGENFGDENQNCCKYLFRNHSETTLILSQ